MSAALEFAGQDLDDWIILYTSDHGEMLGQHSIWEKQKFFEGSARVPLIIRWPKGFKQSGQRIESNVSLCDLYATLCDLTGVQLQQRVDALHIVVARLAARIILINLVQLLRWVCSKEHFDRQAPDF